MVWNKKYFTKEEKRVARSKSARRRYLIHRETILENGRKRYHAQDKEKKAIKQKEYRENNKEKIQIYEEKRRKKKKIYLKEYKKKNKEKLNEKKREYENNKLRTNINFYLAFLLRDRLRKAIRGNYKAGSSVKDLGCSIPEFKLYLESKFQSGMSWDNHGIYGWHIDHIKPLASFNLQNREEFLKACHYTNLQPLWAEENIQKGDKYEI